MKKEKQISFLSQWIQSRFPETENKVKSLLESSKMLDYLSKRIYAKIDSSLQFYVDNAERLKYIIAILNAWQSKEYDGIKFQNLFLGAFAIIYAASPVDVIPDIIPIIGKIDDKFLLKKILILLDDEIEKFKTHESISR